MLLSIAKLIEKINERSKGVNDERALECDPAMTYMLPYTASFTLPAFFY